MDKNFKACGSSTKKPKLTSISNSYSLDLIREVSAANRLLSIEIEPTLACNYRCPYCYAGRNDAPDNELSFDELKQVIKQAKELGAERVIILGGEPLIYPEIFELIDYISSLDMSSEMFSNGSLLTPEIAVKLFKAGVKLVLKLNSFKEEVQAMLTGEKNALKKALDSINIAVNAGYSRGNKLLAVSTVICKQNLNEIELLWTWLRDRNILPYFEVITPQGKALENLSMQLSREEIESIFLKLSELDKKYGYDWEPRPPLAGERCLRHQYSCFVNSIGNIFACVGIDVPVGNIRRTSLKEIICESEIIQDLRNHKKTMNGTCGTCSLSDECYGCRGTAYQTTGNYLASDPLCWRVSPESLSLQTLPINASLLIPHKYPMQLIDSLEKIGEKEFESSAIISPDNLFINSDGTISESCYIEMIAQTMAAGNSFKEQKITSGMLIEVKNFKVHSIRRAGDELTVKCAKTFKFNNWSIIYGEIFCDKLKVAEGELKLWLNQ